MHVQDIQTLLENLNRAQGDLAKELPDHIKQLEDKIALDQKQLEMLKSIQSNLPDAPKQEKKKAIKVQAIGAALKTLRLSKKMSQLTLAEKSKTNQVKISRIELGKEQPDAKLIKNMARALDVKPQDIAPNFN
jgi:ribosome-binding protein aMBF1 (putative translation factor)